MYNFYSYYNDGRLVEQNVCELRTPRIRLADGNKPVFRFFAADSRAALQRVWRYTKYGDARLVRYYAYTEAMEILQAHNIIEASFDDITVTRLYIDKDAAPSILDAAYTCEEMTLKAWLKHIQACAATYCTAYTEYIADMKGGE